MSVCNGCVYVCVDSMCMYTHVSGHLDKGVCVCVHSKCVSILLFLCIEYLFIYGRDCMLCLRMCAQEPKFVCVCVCGMRASHVLHLF